MNPKRPDKPTPKLQAQILAALDRGLTDSRMIAASIDPPLALNTIDNALRKMRGDTVEGRYLCVDGAPRRKHWWRIGMAPAQATKQPSVARRKSVWNTGTELSRPKARRTLDPSAPAIVPKSVKVTVCPVGLDHRFTFTPPPGWVGEFTREWQKRTQTP